MMPNFTKMCNVNCMTKMLGLKVLVLQIPIKSFHESILLRKSLPSFARTEAFTRNIHSCQLHSVTNGFVKNSSWCTFVLQRCGVANLHQQMFKASTSAHSIQENISALQIKKRPVRKKRTLEDEESKPPGHYNVVSFATAEEYNLENLLLGLKHQDLYEPRFLESSNDVIHAVAKYPVGKESREMFFFREGSVVLWNVTDMESGNLLNFLRKFEQDSYSNRLVQNEAELMNYKYQTDGKPSVLEPSGEILIAADKNTLDKYTFSNVMALSVKLGIWEATLEKYIDSIEFVTEDLKRGAKIKMSREEVLRKHGELFALRHLINLGSDLLDTPDFYWDREQLEKLYIQTSTYFSITRRTRVMNEKINHCVELIELLSTHLSDRHHIRLEWMIIILIMVEVGFEIIHYVDRYMSKRIVALSSQIIGTDSL